MSAPEPSAEEAPPSAPEGGWLDARERGGVLAIRFTVFATTVLGRPFARLVARVVTAYYLATAPKARRAIRDYHRRLSGREVGLGEVYRHLLRFVHCTVDAFFLVSGKTKAFEVTRTGKENLFRLRDAKKGAILLGAHLGSFYAMRMQSREERQNLYAVMYTANARMLNDALAKLDPEGTARVLELDPDGGLQSMLRVRELLEDGALVAILGDRIPKDPSPDRVVWAPFLGEPAPFPAGPFLLAALLKCPVYLTFGLSHGTRRYDLYCEPFAERIELPRGRRQEALEEWVARYAERLEEYAKKAPDNWFNFYDFWADPVTRPRR